MDNRRTIITLMIMIAVLILAGTFTYQSLLNITYLDALYMTVITISTVGYTEVAEMTAQAKIFSIFLIMISIGTVGYLASELVSLFSRGYMQDTWRMKKMAKEILNLHNHIILCGAGKTGHYILKYFLDQNVPFVVVDCDKDVLEALKEQDISYVEGNATEDETLEKAGLEKARGLIAVLPTDEDNVLAVLTARQMKQNLTIVSKAIKKTSHDKLKKAGADLTVSPNEIGGRRLATMIMKPSVVSFVDTILEDSQIMVDVEDITITEESPFLGQKLKDLNVLLKKDLMIVGIKREEDFLFNPNLDTSLDLGDTLIMIGQTEQLDKLNKSIRQNTKIIE